MIKFRKLLSVMLCVAMIASLSVSFTGCKKEETEVEDDEPVIETSVSEGEYSGKVKIKLTKAEENAYKILYGEVPETPDFEFVEVNDLLGGQSMLHRYWYQGWDPECQEKYWDIRKDYEVLTGTWTGVANWGDRISYSPDLDKQVIMSGPERIYIPKDMTAKDVSEQYGFALGVLHKRNADGYRMQWFDNGLDYQRYTEKLLDTSSDIRLDVEENKIAFNNVLTDVPFHTVNGMQCLTLQDLQSLGGVQVYKLSEDGSIWGFRTNAAWLGEPKEDGYSNKVIVARVGDNYPAALSDLQKVGLNKENNSIVIPGVFQSGSEYLVSFDFLRHVLGWEVTETVLGGYTITTDTYDVIGWSSAAGPDFVSNVYNDRIWSWEQYMDDRSETWREDLNYETILPASFIPSGRSEDELKNWYGDNWYRDEEYHVWYDSNRVLTSDEIKAKVEAGDFEGITELPCY